MNRLQDQLGHSLAGTHDAGGSHSLVGGDQNEVPHLRVPRRLGGSEGSQDVVRDAHDGVVFNDWDMFVGGGVVDGVDHVLGHDLTHLEAITHVSENRNETFLYA